MVVIVASNEQHHRWSSLFPREKNIAPIAYRLDIIACLRKVWNSLILSQFMIENIGNLFQAISSVEVLGVLGALFSRVLRDFIGTPDFWYRIVVFNKTGVFIIVSVPICIYKNITKYLKIICMADFFIFAHFLMSRWWLFCTTLCSSKLRFGYE